jgi:hypothetical protein
MRKQVVILVSVLTILNIAAYCLVWKFNSNPPTNTYKKNIIDGISLINRKTEIHPGVNTFQPKKNSVIEIFHKSKNDKYCCTDIHEALLFNSFNKEIRKKLRNKQERIGEKPLKFNTQPKSYGECSFRHIKKSNKVAVHSTTILKDSLPKANKRV